MWKYFLQGYLFNLLLFNISNQKLYNNPSIPHTSLISKDLLKSQQELDNLSV